MAGAISKWGVGENGQLQIGPSLCMQGAAPKNNAAAPRLVTMRSERSDPPKLPAVRTGRLEENGRLRAKAYTVPVLMPSSVVGRPAGFAALVVRYEPTKATSRHERSAMGAASTSTWSCNRPPSEGALHKWSADFDNGPLQTDVHVSDMQSITGGSWARRAARSRGLGPVDGGERPVEDGKMPAGGYICVMNCWKQS
jgi:hypothetical protein